MGYLFLPPSLPPFEVGLPSPSAGSSQLQSKLKLSTTEAASKLDAKASAEVAPSLPGALAADVTRSQLF